MRFARWAESGGAGVNGDRALAAVVAVLCVVAFGVAATTLDSSLSSEPGDLVQPDYGGLPFEQKDVTELRKALESNQDKGDSKTTKPTQQGDSKQQPQGGASGDTKSADSSPDQGQDESSSGQKPTEPSLLDRLLAFLLSLWPLLVLLVAAGLVYRYRERLGALLAALVGGVGASGGGGTTEPDPWADAAPDNDVERAWLTMVRAAGLSRPWTKTPGECAEAAVSSGLDPEGVRTITDVYEEVRYGGARPTEGHERRAREGLGRLDVGRRSPV